MRGAIIFVIAFLIFLVVTFGYPDFPPGRMIYDAANLPETDYQVIGISATLLIIAIFNGAIYGIVFWIIYTLAEKAGVIPKKQPVATPTTT